MAEVCLQPPPERAARKEGEPRRGFAVRLTEGFDKGFIYNFVLRYSETTSSKLGFAFAIPLMNTAGISPLITEIARCNAALCSFVGSAMLDE